MYDREDETFIEGFMQLKYLSRMLQETDSDWTVVHRNINKARYIWKRLGKLLRREGSDSRVSALVYRVVVQ